MLFHVITGKKGVGLYVEYYIVYLLDNKEPLSGIRHTC